jgi:hypothetical protein
MGRKSNWISATTLICLLFLPVSTAFAHAQITSTSPLRNAHLTELPKEVMVEFDGNLTIIEDLSINILKVFDQSNRQIDDGKTLVGGARLSIGIADRTGTGTFRVTYRVVSEDGHPVEDEFRFSVLASPTNSPSKRASVAPTAASPEPSVEEIIAISQELKHHESFFSHHWIHFIEFAVVALLIFIWWLVERRRLD